MRRGSSVDILMEEAFHAETILALRGCYVDPFFALSQVKAIFKAGRAQLPPANATFRLMGFLGKKHYNNRAYIRFNFPVQETLYIWALVYDRRNSYDDCNHTARTVTLFKSRGFSLAYVIAHVCYLQRKSVFVRPLPNADFLSSDWFMRLL